MKNKLFLATLATAVAIPVLVAPVPGQYAKAEAKGSVELANNPFKDVKVNNPYYKIIHEMRDAGIIYGYGDGTFHPDEKLNRQHAAALVYRAIEINGLKLEKTKEFVKPKDLATNNPYYNEIKTLIEANLLSVDKNGNINPAKPLTRGEMAKILAVAFNLKVKADYVFGDVKGTEYEEYIKALYSNGVTTGYGDYTFKINESLTRAHYAIFMHRSMNLDEKFVPQPIPESKPEPKPETKPTEKSPIKYSDWSYQDIKTKIPRPKGYVAGEHEKKNAEFVKNIIAENGHGYQASFTIEANSPAWDSSFTFEDKIRLSAENVGTSYEQFVKIINQVIDSGEVYNGETFTVYFDYQQGMICVSGVRNHTI